MSLLKRIGFALFLGLALIAGTWAYLSLKKSKKPNAEALSVLPDSCLVYINTPDFFELNKKLNSQNLLIDKLKLFRDIHQFCSTLQTVDSLLSSSETLRGELESNELHFALYPDLNWLMAFNIKQLGDQQQVAEEFRRVFHAVQTGDNSYAFKFNALHRLYFTFHAGIVLVSDDENKIELAMNKARAKLQQDKTFLEFKSTLEENSPLCVYVNHRLYAASKAASSLDLSAVFKKGFSAGMINLQPSQIAVNGFASCDSSEVLSLIDHQEAQPVDFLDKLPASTRSFTAYGFSSFSEVHNKQQRLFPASAATFWKQVSDSALYNAETDFYENAGNTLLTVEVSPQQQVVILPVNDTAKAMEHLQLMSDSIIASGNEKLYRLKNNGGESLLLFQPLSPCMTQYATFYKHSFFFSETPEQLQRILSDLNNHLLLNNQPSFAAYQSQNFPEAFNYMVYSAPNLMKNSLSQFFNFKAEPGTDVYKNFKHFSFCVTNHASHFKFRWHLLNEAETRNNYPNVLWSLDLDHPAAVTSGTFINHNTGENELVLQDEENELYLINAKGTVLWRKQLDEKILSPVFTVDLFKNNRYQLLFNTAHYLHLIDRNGKEVKGYPVKLPAEASAAMSLFDYDNDKNYRLFIPCKNKTIYNYSVFGVKQEGFNPVRTEDNVNLPLQYVKVGQSDYLVAVDNEGRIYTFSRKGIGRIGLRNRTVEHCTAFYVDATSNINSTYLVYADDKSGMLHKISFSDKKEIVKLSSDISDASMRFALIDGNRNVDVLFTKPNMIEAYDLNGNLLFEKNADAGFNAAGFYSDESSTLFYAHTSENEISLMDQLSGKTTTYKATALPLICNLFNDNKKYLVITNGTRLNCVPLN